MELWGGHECTVNRVGDRYRDQTQLTGHLGRRHDLQRFAELGITTLRYPVLWERIAPDRPDRHDWRWTDERLAEIARLGMKPVAGLVHHGSGPRYTNLLDDRFAALFGEFAAAAAERYPHVEDWTPVNEPLTTARFSALYGYWYPHARDEGLFWRALVNQIDATRAAMRAIRRVNPAARLIQTEDLGHNYATDALAGIADYNNHRRWATWDLLAGRVSRDHPLWPDLERVGLGDRVRAIADDPCPPDVIGVNHYITSERFLDHRLDAYALPVPADGYHDLTAARVLDPPPPGLAGVLAQAWQRYGLPLAVTESHLGCTREEQLRWLWQSWHDCLGLVEQGVDVRALTAWALLGNVDWTSLITDEAGDYEPGAFDVRGGEPRRTAIADLLTALGRGGEAMARAGAHPVLRGPGWWQRDIRLEHAPFRWAEPARAVVSDGAPVRPLVVTGAAGTLGRAFVGACKLRGLEYLAVDGAISPGGDAAEMGAFLDRHRPWAVVDAHGWQRGGEEATRSGADGSGVAVARACAERGIHCTMLVREPAVDGHDGAADGLHDVPAALVVRTGAFFSPYDDDDFAVAVEQAVRRGRRFVVADRTVTPTFVPDMVSACLDLAIDGEAGPWHLTSGEAVSLVEFGRRIAAALDLDPALVVAADPAASGARTGQREAPASVHGRMLPTLAHAIGRHAAVRRAAEEARVPAALAAE